MTETVTDNELEQAARELVDRLMGLSQLVVGKSPRDEDCPACGAPQGDRSTAGRAR